MTTLRTMVKKDEENQAAANDAPKKSAKVSMKDFQRALTKVLPSVSKRDEGLYRALEGSLRKSRSAITSNTDQEKGAKESTGMPGRASVRKY